MKKNNNKLFSIIIIILSLLVLGEIVVYLCLEIANILDNNHNLQVFFAFLTPILLVIYMVIVVIYFDKFTKNKQLKAENKYNFDTDQLFLNYVAFESRIRTLEFFKRKQKAFIIAFTPNDISRAKNLSRNSSMSLYNRAVAEYLDKFLSDKEHFKTRQNTFCYNNGIFIIYTYGDEAIVRYIIDNIEPSLYAIDANNNYRIFVQPYFGFAKVNKLENLYINVDNALTARNQSEKNFEGVTYYNDNLRKSASKEEVDEISQALKDGEFVVFYQPKYSLTKKAFVSSEALVRWNSKKYGFLPPSKFISKAEYGGLIHDIDMFVFRKTCEDLNDAKRRGKRILPVSVNFSLYEFFSPTFIEDVMNIIAENKIDPSLIEIEVTETTSQSNPFLSISIMKKLKEKGLKVLMDDFGVGYSNFSNLKKMPIDTIKIDKSFVDDIVTDVKAREIVKFLISLCRVSGYEVIAEGVDSTEQVEILRKAKCDSIQGYFYSKPLSKADYEKFLIENRFEKKEAK